MSTFVRATKHRSADPRDRRVHVTGDVLHLAVWAADPPGVALLYGTGRFVPLCGGHGHPVEVWARTGPGYRGWVGHAHWPVCRRCITRWERLGNERIEQHRRATEHTQAVAA